MNTFLKSLCVSTLLLNLSLSPVLATDQAQQENPLYTSTLSTVNYTPENQFSFSKGSVNTYTGGSDTVVIPPTIAGEEVTTLGPSVFRQKTNISSVIVPNTVTKIQTQAFQFCSLTSLYLPAGMTSIADNAFQNTNIKVLEYGGSEAEFQALLGDSQLDASIIRYNVSTPTYADSVTASSGANHGDTPHENFFTAVTGVLTGYSGKDTGTLVLPNQINGQDIVLVGDTALNQNKNITAVILPETILGIDSNSFAYANLVSIYIPESVTYIEENAFHSTGLMVIEYGGSEAQWNALTAGQKLNVPIMRYHASPTYVNTVTTSSLENPVDATDSKYFDFTNGVITAYTGSGGEVVIPRHINGKEVVAIAGSVFKDNKSISSVILPETMVYLGSAAFQSSGVSSIYIPRSVTTIGASIFNSSSLKTIEYGGSQTDWGNISGNSYISATMKYNVAYPKAMTETQVVEVQKAQYDFWASSFVNFAEENQLITQTLGYDYTVAVTRLQIADLLVNMIEQNTGTILSLSPDSTFTDSNNSAVLKAYTAGIISGKGDGIFAPDDLATRQEISIMIYNSIKKMEELTKLNLITHRATSLQSYQDADSVASWALEAVATLVANNLMTGSDGKLNPLSNTTIQEAIILTNNLFQLK